MWTDFITFKKVHNQNVWKLHFQTKPTGCTLLLSVIISTSLHVSANYVPIIRRTYCIYATMVFFAVYGWLSGLHYFLVYLFQLLYIFRSTMCPSSAELTVSTRHWYFSLCMGGCLVCTTSWYIYFNFCTCFGHLCAHHQENLLYLCDIGIFHCLWVAVWSALLLGIFISTSLHVSGTYVPIIRRIYCIYVTLVFFCIDGCLVCCSRPDSHPYTVKNTSVA